MWQKPGKNGRVAVSALPMPENDPTGLGAYGSPTKGPFPITPTIRDVAAVLWARPGVFYPLHKTAWHFAKITVDENGLQQWRIVTTHNPKQPTLDEDPNAIYCAKGAPR